MNSAGLDRHSPPPMITTKRGECPASRKWRTRRRLGSAAVRRNIGCLLIALTAWVAGAQRSGSINADDGRGGNEIERNCSGGVHGGYHSRFFADPA
jgi:hypothetical protein